MKTKLYTLSILFLFISVHAFSLDRIVDNADLLSVSEKNDLSSLLDSIATTFNFDLVIVTEKSIGNKSPMEYADDFFDDGGYGMGNGRDGCIFLRVMGSRDYGFSTSGRGIIILNPSAFNKLESDTGKYLGKDDYYAAFRAFIMAWDKFLKLDAKGRSYNFFYRYNLVLMIIAWLVAFVIGLIVVSTWKHGMNKALPKTQAASYIIPESLNFATKKDSFLFSKVEKTKRETQSSASASGSRSAHISSSGRIHGGGGGKR
jgi:uncharacterized protein